jgi:hypothetical protein
MRVSAQPCRFALLVAAQVLRKRGRPCCSAMKRAPVGATCNYERRATRAAGLQVPTMTAQRHVTRLWLDPGDTSREVDR